jgi:DNA-directed RNA polymerase subunit RPC12/RpoP
MIVQCSICGKDLERNKKYTWYSCGECKTKRVKEYGRDYKKTYYIS